MDFAHIIVLLIGINFHKITKKSFFFQQNIYLNDLSTNTSIDVNDDQECLKKRYG